MKKIESLQYGIIFKKAFCVPEIFKAFVRDFLDVDLNIDHVETEKSFRPTIGKIDTRFDLFAEDRENRTVVDIQHRRLPDHYHRFLYYHCIAMIETAVSSKDYSPGLSVYTLVVLTSGDRHKRDVGLAGHTYRASFALRAGWTHLQSKLCTPTLDADAGMTEKT